MATIILNIVDEDIIETEAKIPMEMLVALCLNKVPVVVHDVLYKPLIILSIDFTEEAVELECVIG